MDAKPTADPALLKDMIKKEVGQETCQLCVQLNWLQQAQACSLKGSNKPTLKNQHWGPLSNKTRNTPHQQTKMATLLANHPLCMPKTVMLLWMSCPPIICHLEEESRKPKPPAPHPERKVKSNSTWNKQCSKKESASTWSTLAFSWAHNVHQNIMLCCTLLNSLCGTISNVLQSYNAQPQSCKPTTTELLLPPWPGA